VVTRLAAGLAAVGIAAGAIIFLMSVVATQGWSYPGYISETGVPGSPHAMSYRLGIALLSGGLLLLGLALRHTLPIEAGLLALGGLLAAATSAVNCSAGCPLPPYEVPTLGDPAVRRSWPADGGLRAGAPGRHHRVGVRAGAAPDRST
jgi:hypothetical protein